MLKNLTEGMKLGLLTNIKGFSYNRNVQGEKNVNTDNSTKKSSSSKSISGRIKQAKSLLPNSLRNAISGFNPTKLSSKVRDFSPESVKRSTSHVNSSLETYTKKLQAQMQRKQGGQGMSVRTRHNSSFGQSNGLRQADTTRTQGGPRLSSSDLAKRTQLQKNIPDFDPAQGMDDQEMDLIDQLFAQKEREKRPVAAVRTQRESRHDPDQELREAKTNVESKLYFASNSQQKMKLLRGIVNQEPDRYASDDEVNGIRMEQRVAQEMLYELQEQQHQREKEQAAKKTSMSGWSSEDLAKKDRLKNTILNSQPGSEMPYEAQDRMRARGYEAREELQGLEAKYKKASQANDQRKAEPTRAQREPRNTSYTANNQRKSEPTRTQHEPRKASYVTNDQRKAEPTRAQRESRNTSYIMNDQRKTSTTFSGTHGSVDEIGKRKANVRTAGKEHDSYSAYESDPDVRLAKFKVDSELSSANSTDAKIKILNKILNRPLDRYASDDEVNSLTAERGGAQQRLSELVEKQEKERAEMREAQAKMRDAKKAAVAGWSSEDLAKRERLNNIILNSQPGSEMPYEAQERMQARGDEARRELQELEAKNYRPMFNMDELRKRMETLKNQK